MRQISRENTIRIAYELANVFMELSMDRVVHVCMDLVPQVDVDKLDEAGRSKTPGAVDRYLESIGFDEIEFRTVERFAFFDCHSDCHDSKIE